MEWMDQNSEPVVSKQSSSWLVIIKISCDEDVDGVDDARDVAQDGEQQADPELNLQAQTQQ